MMGLGRPPWSADVSGRPVRMISAVLIVKDEADVLQDTLAALREVVDEIIVADTGSTDGTIAIANSVADVVFSIDWRGDFADARNQAIQRASGDWILSIDADEVVREPEVARPRLVDFAGRCSTQTTGSIEVVSIMCNQGQNGSVRSNLQRFFHRTSVRFEGAIHEQLVPISGVLSSASTHLVVDHSGYAHETTDPAHKAWRNIPLLKSALQRHPDNDYYRFQLGQAYFTVDRFDDAARELEKMLAGIRFEHVAVPTGQSGPVTREILTTAIVSLAYAEVSRQRLDKARNLIDQHQQLAHVGTRWADFQHVCGHVGFMEGDIASAKAGYSAAIKLGPACEDVSGTGSYASAYHLGLLAEVEGKPLEALEHYAQSLLSRADYEPTLDRLIDCLMENQLDVTAQIKGIADTQALNAIVRSKCEHYRLRNELQPIEIIDRIAENIVQR